MGMDRSALKTGGDGLAWLDPFAKTCLLVGGWPGDNFVGHGVGLPSVAVSKKLSGVCLQFI